MSDPQPVVHAPDTIHDGEWVKVKCWACERTSGPKTWTHLDHSLIPACDACHGRGYIMHLVRIKNDAFDRWCQSEGKGKPNA